MDLVLHCHLSLARMMVNTFSWSDNGAITGLCCYQFGSQFNHSCKPNCRWRVSDGQWHLTSSR